MLVREIMSTELETVAPSLPIDDLIEKLISERVGGFPVVEDDKLVGMVTRSDLVRVLDLEHTIDAQLGEALGATLTSDADTLGRRGARIGARLGAMTVDDMMIQGVISVSQEAPVAEAARMLVERGIHRLPVVDGDRLVGIVTSLDIANLVATGGVS